MTSTVIVDIVTAAIGIIMAVVSAYVVPMLKEKLGAERFRKVLGYAEIAVKSANQVFALGKNDDKKMWAVDFLNGILYDKLHIKLSQEEINVIIEAAVADTKAALQQKDSNAAIAAASATEAAWADMQRKGGGSL